ncbi:MAG: DUF411 domain-containing protein [Parcubacteria group bacterium]|nr:DUF411 domain-containing protein [Parcubacteria group bacterium]MBI2637048.1 DUF411 domain-containing protein [Parcubacteria group bacterium]
MKRIVVAGAVGLALAGGVFLFRSAQTPPLASGVTTPLSAVVHKTPTCGCCTNYITYLKRKGFEVEVQNHDDLTAIKEQYGVPAGMESCHTTVIGDYVSEGHVPAETIMSMLSEKPSIAGVALPGMPSGAPGMGGVARGEFTVYGFSTDGEVTRYGE